VRATRWIEKKRTASIAAVGGKVCFGDGGQDRGAIANWAADEVKSGGGVEISGAQFNLLGDLVATQRCSNLENEEGGTKPAQARPSDRG